MHILKLQCKRKLTTQVVFSHAQLQLQWYRIMQHASPINKY